MPKYLFIQRSDPKQQPQQPPSPAEMQEIYAAFNAWMEKFKANISDIGGKLESTGRTVSSSRVTDGPFPEAKEVIGGFMIVSADSYESALEIAKAFPGGMCPAASKSAKSPLSFKTRNAQPCARRAQILFIREQLIGLIFQTLYYRLLRELPAVIPRRTFRQAEEYIGCA